MCSTLFNCQRVDDKDSAAYFLRLEADEPRFSLSCVWDHRVTVVLGSRVARWSLLHQAEEYVGGPLRQNMPTSGGPPLHSLPFTLFCFLVIFSTKKKVSTSATIVCESWGLIWRSRSTATPITFLIIDGTILKSRIILSSILIFHQFHPDQLFLYRLSRSGLTLLSLTLPLRSWELAPMSR